MKNVKFEGNPSREIGAWCCNCGAKVSNAYATVFDTAGLVCFACGEMNVHDYKTVRKMIAKGTLTPAQSKAKAERLLRKMDRRWGPPDAAA